jgi:proteasome lid subunit RPN8/RPN11
MTDEILTSPTQEFSRTETLKPKRKASPLDVKGFRIEPKGRILLDDLHIFVHEKTLREIIAYAKTDLFREVGGVLVGGYYFGGGVHYIEVDALLPARFGESRVGAFKFTHEAWSDIHRRMDADHPEKHIVGWFHTHPNLGVFLSDDDMFIHRHFFSQPWQVALVVEPCSNELAFFQWRNLDVEPCGFLFVRGEPSEPPMPSEPANQPSPESTNPNEQDVCD